MLDLVWGVAHYSVAPCVCNRSHCPWRYSPAGELCYGYVLGRRTWKHGLLWSEASTALARLGFRPMSSVSGIMLGASTWCRSVQHGRWLEQPSFPPHEDLDFGRGPRVD